HRRRAAAEPPPSRPSRPAAEPPAPPEPPEPPRAAPAARAARAARAAPSRPSSPSRLSRRAALQRHCLYTYWRAPALPTQTGRHLRRGPAPSGVSQVDAVEPVEVAVVSGAATGAEPAGAGSGGAGFGGAETEGTEPGGARTGGAEPRGAESGGVETWGAEPGGAATRGTEPGGAEPGVTEPGGTEPGGAGSTRVASRGASLRREVLSPQELREWFARRWSRAAGAGGTPATTGSGGACPGGAGAAGPGSTTEAAGVGPTGGSAGASGGIGAAGSAGPGATGATGVVAAEGVGAGGSADAGASEGSGAGATDAGAPAGSPGAVPAGSGVAPRPRPYFVPLLVQVLGLPPSPGPAPPFECPQPVQSQSLLQPVSPLPTPSPYTGPTGGLTERRAPTSRPASLARPACASRRTSRRNADYLYMILAPFLARAVHAHLYGGDDVDSWSLHMVLLALLRFAHGNLWMAVARWPYLIDRYRIQKKGINFEQVDRESNWDDAIILQALVITALREWLPGARNLPLFSWPGLALVLALHVGPVECLYYWCHRFMHTPFFYASYHCHHHASVATEPSSAHVHTFLEQAGHALLLCVPVVGTWLLGGASIGALYAYWLACDWLNAVGHCNFEFVPVWLLRAVPPLKYLVHTPTYHSLHHSEPSSNYCLFMPVYDLVGATVNPNTDHAHKEARRGSGGAWEHAHCGDHSEGDSAGRGGGVSDRVYVEAWKGDFALPGTTRRASAGEWGAGGVLLLVREEVHGNKLSATIIHSEGDSAGCGGGVSDRVHVEAWTGDFAVPGTDRRASAGKGMMWWEQRHAPPGTHFHQFVVPPIAEVRKDCTYGKLAAMRLPDDVENLKFCEVSLLVRSCGYHFLWINIELCEVGWLVGTAMHGHALMLVGPWEFSDGHAVTRRHGKPQFPRGELAGAIVRIPINGLEVCELLWACVAGTSVRAVQRPCAPTGGVGQLWYVSRSLLTLLPRLSNPPSPPSPLPTFSWPCLVGTSMHAMRGG
ncbi:unnamed protein product, partial [Closterium sp. NIES-54]